MAPGQGSRAHGEPSGTHGKLADPPRARLETVMQSTKQTVQRGVRLGRWQLCKSAVIVVCSSTRWLGRSAVCWRDQCFVHATCNDYDVNLRRTVWCRRGQFIQRLGSAILTAVMFVGDLHKTMLVIGGPELAPTSDVAVGGAHSVTASSSSRARGRAPSSAITKQ